MGLISEESLLNLEALLEQDTESQPNPGNGNLRIDNLGFKKPMNRGLNMTGLMSEKKERKSMLS
jgi:hypothetical protein